MLTEFVQIKLSPNDELFEEGKEYSKNLIPEKSSVLNINIYALPGTIFLINQLQTNNNLPLIINNLGVFSMNVEDRPITSLFINKESFDNAVKHSPIIIDLVC